MGERGICVGVISVKSFKLLFVCVGVSKSKKSIVVSELVSVVLGMSVSEGVMCSSSESVSEECGSSKVFRK